MRICSSKSLSVCLLLLLAPAVRAAVAPIVSESNLTFRVMAANLTGSAQAYEDFALRIFRGLGPDVVAIQEFNYSNNTPAALRAMVDTGFGTNFSYFRESGYSIPNGIISRFPIVNAGSWDDAEIPDRGFAWAQIDLPGTNDLYVVSVHLKASGSASDAQRRLNEANQLTALIEANFPSNAWVVVAGDLNQQTRTEASLARFKQYLSDAPIPTDAPAGGNPNTNNGRNRPYDFVLHSFALGSNQVTAVVGGRSFPMGLVFDSRVFTPLSAVAPIQLADSGNAQHMAVLKDFQTTFLVTNWVNVPPPRLVGTRDGWIQWTGPAGITYGVERSVNLSPWLRVSSSTSSSTNYSFSMGTNSPAYYRLVYP